MASEEEDDDELRWEVRLSMSDAVAGILHVKEPKGELLAKFKYQSHANDWAKRMVERGKIPECGQLKVEDGHA